MMTTGGGIEMGNCAGVDWASEKHDVRVCNAAGDQLLATTFAHDEAGLRSLCGVLVQMKVELVAVERPDGVLVDRLLDAGLRVLALHPNQVAAARARFRASGGKSDQFDAFVICELARTDSHRFRVLEPDSDQTKALKALTRAREDFVTARVALVNQLRAELERFWPGPAGLFSSLDCLISLAFLRRYPSPLDAQRLTAARLLAFLRSQHYSGGKTAAELLDKLRAAAAGCAGEIEAQAGRAIVLALVATLETLGKQEKQLDREIASAIRAHPDGELFLSLFKGADTVLTASVMLAEIGDCRARYPTHESLSGDAGQSPVAVESGKHKVAHFRWACNKRLRDAFCTLADSTRHWHPWAQAVYARAIAKGHDHQRAIRTLGRAWSRVVWRCWQDGVPYELARHRAAQQYITVIVPSPDADSIDVPATRRMAGDALAPSLDVGSAQGSLRAAQPSPPKQRSGGGQSRAARQGPAQRAA
jgi:transposase